MKLSTPLTNADAGSSARHFPLFSKRFQRCSKPQPSLLLAVIAMSCLAVQAQQPAWVTIADDAFAQQYAKQATSDDIKGQSSIAWMLFCRVNQSQSNNTVTWEMWPSNEDTFSPAVAHFAAAKKVRTRPHLQPSKAHEMISLAKKISPMANTPNKAGEEVTRNTLSYEYIMGNKLNTAAGSWKRLSSGPSLNFPVGAVEIKADWAAGSLKGAYTNTDADGNVLSLVGIHIMMKMAPTPADSFHSEDPSWFWTTFEFNGNSGLANAQSLLTYHDALSRDESLGLLTSAGINAGAFANYVCNGTQIRFSDAKNPQIILGNTTMENFSFTPTDAATPADWKTWSVSCHSCHGTASTGPPGNPQGPGRMSANPYFFSHDVTGALPANIASPNYKSFDFVWSLWQAK